jgi:hypothetical protein
MRKTILLSVLVVGCGGGGGGTQTPAPPPIQNAVVGGIWEGQLGSGQQVLGLVTETGEFHFLADDGVQYFGTVTSSANAVSATFTAYTELGTEFQDGTTRGTGSLTGTISARATMSANTTFTTSAGSQNGNTISLTYNALYDRDSSLGTIAGNFTDGFVVVNINANGVAFAQDPASGCVLNGNVSIINAGFNAYRVQYTYSGCQGELAVLNGSTFRGLGVLDNTVSPEELVVGSQGLIGNVGISEIFVIRRT